MTRSSPGEHARHPLGAQRDPIRHAAAGVHTDSAPRPPATTDTRSALRKHAPFLALLLVAAALYTGVLLTSERAVDADEAVVGIMARHVLTRGARPIFYYGQAYGGGGAIEAYLAAVGFSAFGVSAIALKAVALLCSLVGLVGTYAFCLRYGRERALLCTAVLALMTPLVAWHTKMRGGYAALPLFQLALLWVFCRWYAETAANAVPRRWAIAFGILAGASIYNQPLVVPCLLTLALVAACTRPMACVLRSLTWVASGALIGSTPILVYTLREGTGALRFLTGLGDGPTLYQRLRGAALLLPSHLPSLFVQQNVDGHARDLPLEAWLEYAVVVGLTLTLVLYRRNELTATVRRMLSRHAATTSTPRSFSSETIILLIIASHLAASSLSAGAGLSPRYFIALFPFLAITTGLGAAELTLSTTRWRRRLGAAGAVAVLALGSLSHLRGLGDCTVTDVVLVEPGRFESQRTASASITEVVAALDAAGVRHVRAPYFIKWRLLFETEERILASCAELQPQPPTGRFLEHDRAVAAARRVGIVLNRRDHQLQRLESTPPTDSYTRRECGDFVVLLPPESRE